VAALARLAERHHDDVADTVCYLVVAPRAAVGLTRLVGLDAAHLGARAGDRVVAEPRRRRPRGGVARSRGGRAASPPGSRRATVLGIAARGHGNEYLAASPSAVRRTGEERSAT